MRKNLASAKIKMNGDQGAPQPLQIGKDRPRGQGLAALGWLLRDVLGLPESVKTQNLRRMILDHLAAGNEGTVEEIARAITRRTADVRIALRELVAQDKVTGMPEKNEGAGVPRFVYRRCARGIQRSDSVTACALGPRPIIGDARKPDYLRFEESRVGYDYLLNIVARSSTPSDSEAIRRLERVLDPKPTFVARQDAYDHGIPPASQWLVPLLINQTSDPRGLNRALRVLAEFGALARNNDPFLGFSLGLDLCKKGSTTVGMLVPGVVDANGCFRPTENPNSVEVLFERHVLQLAGFWRHWCQHGAHPYFADSHARDHCPRHGQAGRDAKRLGARRTAHRTATNRDKEVESVLTVREAARRLGVSPRRVLALIHSKRVPACRRGWGWTIQTRDLRVIHAQHKSARAMRKK